MKNNSGYQDIITRIHHVTKTRTQTELATLLGIRQSSISDSKRRDSIPNNWYLVLFEKLGVNPDWLKSGLGPMYLRRDSGYQPSNDTEEVSPAVLGDALARPIQRTVYAMHGKSLDGLQNVTEIQSRLHPTARIVLPKAYATEGCVILEVDSEAMAPFIRKGAHVGIDTRARNVVSGEVFAVLMPHEGIVLRRIFCEGESLVLRAEGVCAARFPDSRIPATELSVRMFGRLAWVLQAG